MLSQFKNRFRRASALAPVLAGILLVVVSGCASVGGTGEVLTPALPTAVEPTPGLGPEATVTNAADHGIEVGGSISVEAAHGDSRLEREAATSRSFDPDTEIAGDTPEIGAPTNAEQDFDALYGPYNPVADPTLPAEANIPGVYDPWERYNRSMHRFNNAVDRNVARPLAQFYVAVAPRPVRLGVSNFFSNLGQPVTAINALLQGKPTQAAHALGRFLLNTTLGIGGIFDPASDAHLDRRSEDLGQTLGVWGWERSRYVELPLFGPRTVRDVLGMVGDAPLSPLRQVDEDKIRIPLQGLQLVDIRTQLLSTDSLREGVADDYTLVRDAWMQRRNYQILGDRMTEDVDESLPDYLRDDDHPLVPASAMPVMPTD